MTGEVMVLAAEESGPFGGMMGPLIGVVVMMIVFNIVLGSGRRKDEKRRKEMLNNLKRSDRVLTRGGVLGTVVAVKGEEITLKVDESTNTKMTFVRGYIDRVLTDDDKLGTEPAK